MTRFARRIRPQVEQELQAADKARAAGDTRREFAHLERAHVLGQASTREHVRAHCRMLRWAWRHRDAREALGLRFQHLGGHWPEGVAVAVEFPAHFRADLGVADPPRPEVEEHADSPRLAREPVHLGAQQRVQTIERLRNARDVGGDVQDCRRLEQPVEQRQDELVLRLEVEEDEAVADPRLARDFANGERVESFGARDGVRGLDDLPATNWFGGAISRQLDSPPYRSVR